jgi:hypothetical protein
LLLWPVFRLQSEDDILLHDELEACAKDPRFTLWLTIDKSLREGWRYRCAADRFGDGGLAFMVFFTISQFHGFMLPSPVRSTGFISEEMIRAHLPAPGDGVHVRACPAGGCSTGTGLWAGSTHK